MILSSQVTSFSVFRGRKRSHFKIFCVGVWNLIMTRTAFLFLYKVLEILWKSDKLIAKRTSFLFLSNIIELYWKSNSISTKAWDSNMLFFSPSFMFCKKSCILETQNLATDADSSTNILFPLESKKRLIAKKQFYFAVVVVAATSQGKGDGVHQWEARIQSCDLRANERPKKITWKGDRELKLYSHDISLANLMRV